MIHFSIANASCSLRAICVSFLFVQGKCLTAKCSLQENRLKQVQEMQLSCDKGLNHMACDAPLLGPMAELWLVPHDISP
jgi:hypothetical protein